MRGVLGFQLALEEAEILLIGCELRAGLCGLCIGHVLQRCRLVLDDAGLLALHGQHGDNALQDFLFRVRLRRRQDDLVNVLDLGRFKHALHGLAAVDDRGW